VNAAHRSCASDVPASLASGSSEDLSERARAGSGGRSRLVSALLFCLLFGCSHDAFDPGGVALEGRWSFDIDDRPSMAPPGLVNPCQVRNLPVDFYRDSTTGVLYANTFGGGTIRCQVAGVWGTSLYGQSFSASVVKVDGDVAIISPRGDTLFVGRLSSASAMSGTVVPSGWFGRTGTWSARRS